MVHQRRRFGNWGEDRAVRYLERQGYEILDRNYSCAWGELDIVARHRGVVAFVEVKSRHSLKFGRPAAAVTRTKQLRLRKTAWCYLREHPVFRCRCRFDIIEILDLYGEISLNHLKNCF
ncbi:YraN family protein [Acidaminococcus massiliensis]|jgi:putative endonuclease|uniref:YraN family protein n=1 Tax=Acidaminococcus massiliensis TaxID=1852375 RepID=UPI0022E15E99|nr:YraN family protein [Acidaminococcus massiliensis]